MKSSRIRDAAQENNYPKSLLGRSLLFRPLPRGKKVLLVMIQFILLNIFEGVAEVYFQVLLGVNFQKLSGALSISIFISVRSLPSLLCLPMGFIADRYFGRAKVIYYSWILLFVNHVGFCIGMLVVYNYRFSAIADRLLIIVLTLAMFGKIISLAGIRVNLIPFGVDQMEAASSDQISSYFHWYYWSRNAGLFIAYSLGILGLPSLIKDYTFIAAWLVPCIAAAAGTVINMCCYSWFVKKENVSNPLLLIYRVLSYAASVRRPVYQSAFSYDGRPTPSKIDLAKETHFGKFRDEQVEDVKAFLRILRMLISLAGFLCVYALLNSVYVMQSIYLDFPNIFSNNSSVNCSSRQLKVHEFNGSFFLVQWIFLINVATVLLLIPLLDRIIYPLCCVTPMMFNRIGTGMFASFVSISCALVVEAIRYSTLKSQGSHSTLEVNMLITKGVVSAPVSVGVMAFQYIFQAVAECLALITMVEFIYAQSPAYMKGLLLGCLFFTGGLSMNLGSLLILSQWKGTSVYWEYLKTLIHVCDASTDAGSCFATYIIIAIMTLLGMLLFIYSAKKYKSRSRDKDLVYYCR